MLWFIILFLLIVISAFFSGSETGMMAVNRYRLRHLARHSHKSAQRVLRLLKRPDRLLGVILIGNTFSNILASAVATMVAVRYFGEVGALISTIALTFVVLLFAETAPKTVAALYSEHTAFLVSGPLSFLLKILYPFVWVVNGMANGFLKILGIKVKEDISEPLSIDELRSVVHEATGRTSLNYQEMMLRVLDLHQVTVDEVMVPKGDIYGIDLERDWDTILNQLTQSKHSYLPLYREHIDKVQGMLPLRHALLQLRDKTVDKHDLMRLSDTVYFIPEGALLHQQILNFQREQKTVGLVVDEYGDIQGMLTLRDVLEEIVGEFDLSETGFDRLLCSQKDGSVMVDGSISVRDLNRLAHWQLPVDGPRTLSGLMIEYLEMIPRTGVGARIGGYPMEVVSVSRNTIRQVRVWPELYMAP